MDFTSGNINVACRGVNNLGDKSDIIMVTPDFQAAGFRTGINGFRPKWILEQSILILI
jgi:hypothetical protein